MKFQQVSLRFITQIGAITPVVFRGVATFLLNKLVASYFGAQGLSLFGTGANIMSVLNVSAAGGTYNGIVQLFSSNSNTKEDYSAISVLTCFGALFSLLIISSLFLFTNISKEVTISLFSVFCLLLAYIGYSIASVLNAKFSAQKQILHFGIYGMTSGIFYIVFILIAIIGFKYNNPIAILSAFPISLLVCAIPFIYKTLENFKKNQINHQIVLEKIKFLFKFSLMALSSAFLTPIAQIIIRNSIERNAGLTTAGEWQALLRFSDILNILIGSYITVKIYPKTFGWLLVRANATIGLDSSLKILQVALVFPIINIFFGAQISHFLYSNSLNLDTITLFSYLLGDSFKIASIVLGYMIVSTGSPQTYLVFDLTNNFLLVASSIGGYFFGGLQMLSIFYLGYSVFWFLFLRGYIIRKLSHMGA